MTQYSTVLTAVGEAKVAAAQANGASVAILEMAIGDGGGAPVTPVENRSGLVNEVNRGPLNTMSQDPVNPSYFTAERVIGPTVGGWTIREIGLFDDDGDMVAYGNFPDSYKPMLAEGSGKELVIRMQFEVASANAVTLLIDPTIVLATRAWVTEQLARGRPLRHFNANT